MRDASVYDPEGHAKRVLAVADATHLSPKAQDLSTALLELGTTKEDLAWCVAALWSQLEEDAE